MMRPTGPRVGVGQRVTSTVTISPGSASRVSPRGMCTSVSSAAVERHDEAEPGRVDVEAADDGLRAALENLDDAAFDAAVGAMPLDAHDDAVAVQRFLEIGRGDENVALHALERPLGCHEAEARRMGVEPADDQIHPIGEAVAVAADEDERAVGDERSQMTLERRVLLARDTKSANQLAGGGGVVYVLADLLRAADRGKACL